MFAANGVRPAQNNYLLDGIDNNTSNVDFLSGVAYIVKPPIDAVDEIKVMTSSFSAEYGRAGGAVLNTTLKSGSNQLRGHGLGVLPQRRDERERLLRQPRQHQEGRVPVEPVRLHGRRTGLANKTFWFADYEGSLIKQARTWVTTVPTALQRSSGFTNFSDLITLQTGTVGADILGRTVPARHGLRSGDDAPGRRRPGRSGHRAGRRRRPASCAIRSPTTASRRAGSTRTRCG